MTDQEAVERLLTSIEPGPDDFDHPGHDRLEALVDGRLDEADQIAVQSHVDLCIVCAEDVSDLATVRAQLAEVTGHADRGGPRRPGLAGVARARRSFVALASLAAALLLAEWGIRTYRDVDAPEAPATAAAAIHEPFADPAAVDVLTPDERAVVARVLGLGKIELPPDVLALNGPAGTLLGETRRVVNLEPVAPIGTAVLTTRPELSWRPVTGATGYSVAVFDEFFKEVANSGRQSGTSWVPSADLPRGGVFAWQITAYTPSGDVIGPAPPRPEARFLVLSALVAQSVADQRQRLAGQPLTLGILLARAGLVPDAIRSLEEAARQPADASRAAVLLADLKSR